MPLATKRIAVCAPICAAFRVTEKLVAPIAAQRGERIPRCAVERLDSDVLAAIKIVAFVVEADGSRSEAGQIGSARDGFAAVDASITLEDAERLPLMLMSPAVGLVGVSPPDLDPTTVKFDSVPLLSV